MNTFFSPASIFLYQGIAIIRIIVGMLLIYHGIEIFNPELMNGYVERGMLTGPYAKIMAYLGKGSELTCGILLSFGLLTRVAALTMICTFSYITFFIGQGRFWYEEQHPFMFALFGLLFLFTGPGAWSLDRLIFKTKHKV
jgi:putative oxidoreductase